MYLYHGSQYKVEKPQILLTKFTKDFGYGFYTTKIKEQALRWACRFDNHGIINIYEYFDKNNLKIKKFETMTEEWLDFIVDCRAGIEHDYDLVEGPMADDQIYNYIQNFISGTISREAFWALAKFKNPTHQFCFHTEVSLDSIKFLECSEASI